MSDAGEIVRSGAVDKLADIVHKLAGPMADEVGLLLADKIKVYRLRNFVNVVAKMEKILAAANLPAGAVPPRMFIPLLEASSLEADISLQDLWAGLLASASQQCDSMSPTFVDTLKQLTPGEARILNSLFDRAKEIGHVLHIGSPDLVRTLFPDTFEDAPIRMALETLERIGLIRRRYNLKRGNSYGYRIRNVMEQTLRKANKNPVNIVIPKEMYQQQLPKLTYELEFTEYGVQFMTACHGPSDGDAPMWI